jgi:DNA-binding MarR family transcriptional regulator
MKNVLNELEIAAWAGFVMTQGRLFRRIEDELRQQSGITHSEYEVLLRLNYSKERRERIQTLAAKSLLSRSGTSRAVDRLVKVGYVKRSDAEEDGRGAYAELTARGRAFFEKTQAEHLKLVKDVYISKFNEPELKLLAEFWKRFAGM